jgi:glycosyltransferase involved in cell wall biosynthesis
MNYNLSGCVFIKDTFKGAFCLFESMYQLLPLCDEFVIMDLGSTDGTLEALKEIEKANSKVRIVRHEFPYQDAGVFATLANDLIAMCNYPNVLYYQADEIWHEDLVKLTREKLDLWHNYCQVEQVLDFSFWRVQLKYNFQRIKWYPHPVHRIGSRDNFVFDNDGMNTKKVFDTVIVSNY